MKMSVTDDNNVRKRRWAVYIESQYNTSTLDTCSTRPGADLEMQESALKMLEKHSA